MKTNKAYAQGALDGFTVGVSANPYDFAEDADKHQAYKQGYDYGIFLYTQDIEEE